MKTMILSKGKSENNDTFKGEKNIKIFVIIIYIIIAIFLYLPLILIGTYSGKSGLYCLLIYFISYHAFMGLNLLLIIKIFTTKIINKNKKILINIIILIIYVLTVPCIFLIRYVPDNCNSSYIGNNFVILNNIISDIILDKTYDIKATTYTFETVSVPFIHKRGNVYVDSSYVKFDNNSFAIPITPKDEIVIKLLFNSYETNTITLYKKSGLIKSINGKNVNISLQEYLKIKEEQKKELTDKLIRTKIEEKKEDLFQISIGLNGAVTRSTWVYEKEIDLFWVIKKDGKEIQRLNADTMGCTFNDNGDKTSKYTILLIGSFQGKEYQLSQERVLGVILDK